MGPLAENDGTAMVKTDPQPPDTNDAVGKSNLNSLADFQGARQTTPLLVKSDVPKGNTNLLTGNTVEKS